MNEKSAGKLLALGSKPTLESQVKAMVASAFATDANDFLWRAHLLLKSEFQHRSFFGKIAVDYRMAIECSMKAAIVYLSKPDETPTDAYLKARRMGHKLPDLLAEARSRAYRRVRFLDESTADFIDSMILEVTDRYDADLRYLHFTTRDGYSSKMRDMVRSEEFMNQLRTASYESMEFVEKCRKRSANKSKPTTGGFFGNVQEKFSKLPIGKVR